MTNLMQYVDICIGNEEDAEKVLGFKPEGSDVMSGNLELSGYMNIFGQMADRFGFRYIASSLRESHSASTMAGLPVSWTEKQRNSIIPENIPSRRLWTALVAVTPLHLNMFTREEALKLKETEQYEKDKHLRQAV